MIKSYSYNYLGAALALLLGYACTSTPSASVATEPTSEPEEAVVHMSHEQLRAVGIELGPLEYKELSATIRANGSLRVPKSHKGYVTALYGGTIKEIHTQPGQYVRRGQLIATLVNPQFVQLQEEYLTARGRLVYAEQELARQQALQGSGAGTTKHLQSAQAELTSLGARTSSLAQQLKLAGLDPRAVSSDSLRPTLSVVSPIDGVIGEILEQIGSYIEPAKPIAEVIDNASLHLDLNIYEQDLPKIKVGQTIHFMLTNNPSQEYDARVHTIGSTFEPDSRTIAVHCDLLGDKAGFIDGMNITGLVSLGEELLAAVPDEAIVHVDGEDYIFVQQDLGHDHEELLEFVPVQVIRGASQLGYTAITPLEPLGEETVIVRKGAFFVNARLREANADHGHAH